MAGIVVVQSLLTAGPTRPKLINTFFRPANHTAPRLRLNAAFRVRAMKQEGKENTDQPPNKSVSTNILDIFAFDGPAPERINGRLAMVGFTAALAVELARGQDLFSQIQTGGGVWFLGTSLVLTMASLIPQLRGITVDSQSVAPMTSNAELWNGRLAMLGLVALALTEFVKGGTLV